MNKKIPYNDFTINSLVGEGAEFRGEFNISGPLRIDGDFNGKINSTGKVYIGKKGKAGNLIIAKTVVIGGLVKGDVYAEENISILKTAEVLGNLYSASVNMESGVIFDGDCRIFSKADILDLINTKRKEKFLFL